MRELPSPIRIARVIARLNIGGPAVHVTLLSKRLGPPRYQSTLICGKIGPAEGDMSYLARREGVEPVVIPELGRELSPIRDMVALFKLWRLFLKLRPHIVHTHTAKAGFLGRLAARLAGVPVIVHTFHGHVLRGYFGPLKSRLFLELERLSARYTSAIITLSERLQDELVEYGVAPPERFVVVPLGLDLRPFAETPRHSGAFRRELGLGSGIPLVGVIGRLVPIKAHDVFLKAAERVLKSLPDAHFVIVGDGELRGELEALAGRMGLGGSVTFTGWIDDLRPVYSDLDVLVISSRNEGTPVSVIEAMAAGVPVAVTRVGGLPDLVEDGWTGMLAPPDDPDALAESIRRLLTDRELAEDIAKRARPMAIERFSIERLIDDLDSLYTSLLEAKR